MTRFNQVKKQLHGSESQHSTFLTRLHRGEVVAQSVNGPDCLIFRVMYVDLSGSAANQQKLCELLPQSAVSYGINAETTC